jgi:glutamyl-tRNA(Gln) amidotransferase subunit E
MLKLRDELHRRGFTTPVSISVDAADVTDLFANSEYTYLRREVFEQWAKDEKRRPAFELGAGPFVVKAVRLKGLTGTLSWPSQPDLTFAHELAGRVRVISGLDQAPILLSGEKWPDYKGALQELRRARTRLHCESDDAVVVVWGPEEDCRTAVQEIRLRYADATDGVPNETRQPFEDGSTDFERILPGPDRMYPDTDSPPTRVTRERVLRLEAGLAEKPWHREARYAAVGVPAATAHYLIRRGGAGLVDRVVTECGADLRQACFVFGERWVGWRRAGIPVGQILSPTWCEFFRAIANRPVLFEARDFLVRKMAEAPGERLEPILERYGFNGDPGDWQATLLQKVAEAAQAAFRKDPELVRRLAMGRLMSGILGKVPARVVAEALQRQMEEGR